ncbi:hypothetical protein Ahy_A04g018407 isoform C [Arachis hypogaea]|uniref:Uncharacterized protein n=1 Tax=Arachis hypogaea TaxID=3818 RepID=A0A445DDL6_ARAHY|nr:hypothetical protein Ahy_A04g018407 isoform C [Arachis hypogaea]
MPRIISNSIIALGLPFSYR